MSGLCQVSQDEHHNCVSLEELKSLKSPSALEKPEFCRQHPEKVKLFCLTCQVLICKDCAHKNHSYNFIDTVSKDERNVLGKALESLSANLEAIKAKQETVSGQILFKSNSLHNYYLLLNY